MGIFSRLSDIINSNINALLDKAEDPEKLIRMVIQEMEETLVDVRSTTAKIIADKKELLRRSEKLTRQAEEWQQKAELALSRGRDELAKAALLEKSTILEVIAAVAEDLVKLDESLEKLSGEIEQLQAKLTDARARQKALSLRVSATQSRHQVSARLHNTTFDSALNRFEHFERKIDAMESEIEARAKGRGGIAAEFAAMEKEGRIEQELAALKARLQRD
jgi:phage shock protein A